MDAYLQLSTEDKKAYCDEAGAKLGLIATSVEKDFWVTFTLRELFSLETWGEQLAFKGGPSLSKAWGLIERFIDNSYRRIQPERRPAKKVTFQIQSEGWGDWHWSHLFSSQTLDHTHVHGTCFIQNKPLMYSHESWWDWLLEWIGPLYRY